MVLLGMGYGTISTTFLLANGVSPAIVSSRVHSARVFSSGVSGYSHHRFGNINKKLFKALVIPGVIGAILGATLAFYAQKYSTYVRIPFSFYTVYLGFFIIRKAFRKHNANSKVKEPAGLHRRWLYGCVCGRWLGLLGYQYAYFKKKKSALCGWIRLPRRIFCGACEFYYLFYFSEKHSFFRYCGTYYRWLDRRTNCSTACWKIAVKNNVYIDRLTGDSYQLLHALESIFTNVWMIKSSFET